ncbi:MAG: Xaa-Pro peptidase family protein [Conexivisphaerales archaeon]
MLSIPEEEYLSRLNKLTELMEKKGFDAIYLSSGTSFSYFTGYHYIATERPAALIVRKNGDVYFMGPVMESEHIKTQTKLVREVYSYFDYPGEVHPMKRFAEWIEKLGLRSKKIGTESLSFYSSPWGYKGISLKELLPDTNFELVWQEVYDMRMLKSDTEIRMIRESVRWGEVAHGYLQRLIRPGLYDWEVSAEASLLASREMKKALGADFKASTTGGPPAHAGIRGQVGEHSAFPHSLSIERPIQKGDIIGTGASADVFGYHSELERNLFIGKIDEKAKRYHRIALRMQKAAMDAIAPGKKCSEADIASRRVAREEGVEEFLLHHTGHGMGLEGHEAPFLDAGESTILQPGMVVSVEPGIYIKGFGGFRHSDTVVVREDGIEVLNSYPRETDELIVPEF